MDLMEGDLLGFFFQWGLTGSNWIWRDHETDKTGDVMGYDEHLNLNTC